MLCYFIGEKKTGHCVARFFYAAAALNAHAQPQGGFQ